MVSHMDHRCYITPSPSDPHLSASKAWHGQGEGHTAPPSLRVSSTSAWVVPALKTAFKTSLASVLPLLGPKDGPSLTSTVRSFSL